MRKEMLRKIGIYSSIFALIIGLFNSGFITSKRAFANDTSDNLCVGATSCGVSPGNKYFVYVKSGESISIYQELKTIASAAGDLITTIYDQNKNLVTQESFKDKVESPQKGDNIDFSVTNSTGSDGLWIVTTTGSLPQILRINIDVIQNGVVIPGRTFVEQLNIYQGNASTNTIYGVNDQGYIYKITMRGFNGLGSTFKLDSKGTVDSLTGLPVYKSYTLFDTGYTYGTGTPYRIFLDVPAADLPAQALTKDGLKYVKPPLLSPDLLVKTQPVYTPSSSDHLGGTFTTLFDTRFSGNFSLQIDVNNNGSFDDPIDVSIPGTTNGGQNIIQWDGKDGEGNVLSAQDINSRIFIEKYGEMHLIRSDVEGNNGGVTIEAMNNPDTSRKFLINWNDSLIEECNINSSCPNENKAVTGPRKTFTDPIVGNEVDSENGAHGWDYSTAGQYGWGESAVVDDWVYATKDTTIAETVVDKNDSIQSDTFTASATQVSPSQKPTTGDQISATVTLDNSTGGTQNDVVVSAVNGTTINVGTINPGEIKSYTVSRTITQSDVDSLTDANLNIQVSRTDPLGEERNWSKAFAWTPLYDLKTSSTVKMMNSQNDEITEAKTGDKVHFQINVSNTGNVTLNNTSVTSNKGLVTTGTVPALSPGDNASFNTNEYTITESDNNSLKQIFTITANSGNYSTNVSKNYVILTKPSTPENISLIAGDKTVNISWTSPDNGGSVITGYAVTSTPDNKTCSTNSQEETSCSITGLSNGTSYTFSVTAENNIGVSNPGYSQVSVIPIGQPSKPQNILVDRSEDSAIISWDPSEDNGGQEIINYTVTTTPDSLTCSTNNSDETSCTITNLDPNTTYSFFVVANGEFSSSQPEISKGIVPLSFDTGQVNVLVDSTISLTLNDDVVDLSDIPGSTNVVTDDNEMNYTVTTNNLEGYSITIKADNSTLDSAIVGNTDNIPVDLITVAQTDSQSGTGSNATALSSSNDNQLYSQDQRSIESGDSFTSTFNMTEIPWVNADDYTGTVTYTATAN